MDDRNIIIGQQIGKARTKDGESQAALAEALGVKREMVNYWENGKRPVKAETIYAIAKRYNVTSDFLLGLSDHDTVNPDMQTAIKTTGLSEKAIQNLQELSEDDIVAPITDKLLASDLYKNDFISALSNAFVAAAGVKMEISQIDTLSRTDAYSCVYRLMKELKYSVFEVSESATRLITSLAGIEEEKQKLKEKEAALDDALEEAIRRYENGERS